MEHQQKYPIGGFAPGRYQCTCITCSESFIGDKRAVQCEPCAVKMTSDKSNEEMNKEKPIKEELELIKTIELGVEGFAKLTARHALGLFKLLHLDHFFSANITDDETGEEYSIGFCKKGCENMLPAYTKGKEEAEGGGWISVDESLPEEDPEENILYVLVHLDTGMIFKGRKYSNGWTAFFADGEKGVEPHSVTHWQPLPLPPNPQK